MKQSQKKITGLLFKSKTAYLFFLLIIAASAGMYSCKGKKDGTANWTEADSLNVAYNTVTKNGEAFLQAFDSIRKVRPDVYQTSSFMNFTAEQQAQVFTSDQVKQVKFTWVNLGGDNFGLQAWGLDAEGVQLSGPVPLTQLNYPPVPNIFNLGRVPLYLNRGELKEILGVPPGTGPIEPGSYSDVIFSPSQTSNSARKFKIYCDGFCGATAQMKAINPSPPASSPCRTTCD